MLYDAVIAAQNAGPGPLTVHLRLQVSGEELKALCHTEVQKRVLARPGHAVDYVPGSIRPDQVQTHRPSYINAILIQRSGILIPGGCSKCRTNQNPRPFPECRYIPNEFGNACGNCKWKDHASKCRHAVHNDGDHDPEDDFENDDSDDEPLIRRRVRTRASVRTIAVVEVPPVPNPEDFVDIGDIVDSDEDASVYEDAQEN